MKKPVRRKSKLAESQKQADKSRAAARKIVLRPEPETPPRKTEAASDDTPVALPDFMIAGIGASAGGLEACSSLLESLPGELGLALIIVQHLAPKHDSFLPELLAARAKMPVVQVTEGIKVEANRVYVIPPNVHMHIADGNLHLVARPEDRTQHMPVDSFFRSLAEYAQSRAIGIILSGTASDGAIGVREIKGAGGITIVQDPHTAKSDGMPRAAISTGAVDLVLPPQGIADELVRIASHPLVRGEARKTTELTGMDEQLPRIFSMLRNATGVDFTHYKQPTIKRRLQRRMVLHKLETLQDYIKFLQQNPGEVNGLYQDILIHVTRFFRDPESFQVLAQKAFASMNQNRGTESPIRIWVPGCATGEEAYSVAIALQEYLGDQASGTPIQVFGTDVSEVAIDHARAGIYPESISGDVSAERLRRFFTRTDGGFRINKTIRDLCIFARQDITRDPPFSKLDLILCRNVLIYLGGNLQKRLMGVFHYALKNTGFLMLGSAETVGAGADYFGVVDKRYKLYSKKLVGEHVDVEFPIGNYSHGTPRATKTAPVEPRPSSIQSEANHIILSRYSPAGVVVDDDLQIVQFRGQTGKFLEPPPGDPSLNLLKMAREGLLYGIRTALHEVRKLGEAVRREGLRVRTNGGMTPVAIEVVPLRGVPGDRHFLVLFEEEAGHKDGDAKHRAAESVNRAGKGKGKPDKQNHRNRELEKELAASREYLQSIIQDLEAANEELQSANEEILSANEELQSTNEELDTAKEELQSTNEELNTVNEELQSRNEELSHVNSDLINLLANVQIAIVMVSNDLRVRRFTPMAERVLNLIPTDVGRPISDIKPNIDCPNLEAQITEAVDSMSVKESECRDRNGKLYSLRIRPYKNIENRIDGAVIALFEIQGRGEQSSGKPPTDGQ
jgi:two-component system CheB/CheR fusion protein